MIISPEEKIIYSEIQKKLFYIIPEKWESIYLYASIMNAPNQKAFGEMFFYYLPKGLIKRKFVNSYEIPGIFNIDEQQYSKLITEVYKEIKDLRNCFIRNKKKAWTNITIIIKDAKFRIEYDYENLFNSPYDSYQRHVIWRYIYLKDDYDLLSRKEQKIIKHYLENKDKVSTLKKYAYEEGFYRNPVKNIIDYEKNLSVDEALAQSKEAAKKEKKKLSSLFKKKNKLTDIIEDEDTRSKNQILKYGSSENGKKEE